MVAISALMLLKIVYTDMKWFEYSFVETLLPIPSIQSTITYILFSFATMNLFLF